MIDEATIAPAPEAERETILIVEDDLGIATLERRRLGRHGYGVVCATNAEDALGLIEEGGIGLVVLDQGLPGGTSGLELYRRMKASGRDLPVVMVTGQSSEETLVEALRLGVRDFITKSPDYLDYLPGAVEAAVAQSRLARRLEESEGRFRGLIENLQVGVVLAGPDGEILVSNRAALRLLRAGEGSSLDGRLFEACWEGAIREDGSPFPVAELPPLRAIADGRPVRDAVVGLPRGAGNNPVWLLVNAEPQPAPDGGVRQVICTISDVTERKALEEQLAYRAYHDVLTGLPNRALFLDRLRRRARSDRSRRGARAWRCCSWTWTTSRWSTTPWATRSGDRLLVEMAERLREQPASGGHARPTRGRRVRLSARERRGSRDALMVVTERILEPAREPRRSWGGERRLPYGERRGGAGRSRATPLPRPAQGGGRRRCTAPSAAGGAVPPSSTRAMHEDAMSRLELEADLQTGIESGKSSCLTTSRSSTSQSGTCGAWRP